MGAGLKITVRGRPAIKGREHSLKANPGSPRPVNLLFLDTETEVVGEADGIQWHRFRLGVTCYIQRRFGERKSVEQWRLHRTPESLCESIEGYARPKTSLYVYASNPSFDLWVLRFYEWFATRGWRAGFVYDEGTRFILTCRRGKAAIKVCAVQNYFEGGVGDWGKMVGLPKLDTDPLAAPVGELEVYCRRDVEIIKEAVLAYLAFCEAQNVGGFALTLSGQAFRCYRHRFLKHRLWVHRDEAALALERRAYFGGRTECFFLGKRSDGPFLELDVNSLYPFVMWAYPYPFNFKSVVKSPTLAQAGEALQRGCVVADVTLDIEQPLWAVLLDGRTCFPVGEWQTSVCSMGLLMAIKTGALVKIHSMAVYQRGHIFREFVSEFYKLRQQYKAEGRKTFQALCKKFLNSLYGKFGQANPATVLKGHTDDPGFMRRINVPAAGGGAQIITQIMGSVFVEQGREEGKDSMPAVAAHVTEYGRFYLARLIAAIGWEKVLYCDTDSLLVPESELGALREYLDADRLGGLKVKERVNTVTLFGAKDYVMEGRRVIKGVPEGAVEARSGEFVVTQWPKLKGLLSVPYGACRRSEGLLSVAPEKALSWQRLGLYPVLSVCKVLQRDYRKGIVAPDGRVEPFRSGAGLF